MALLLPTLQNALEGFFADPGDSEAEAISGWGQVIFDYTSTIVPPSTNGLAAKTVFESALVGMSAPGAAPAKLVSAFASHATSLAAGMVPPGSPPASVIVLSPVASALYSSHADAAVAWATVIDTWYRMGTTSLGAPWS